MLPPPWNQKAQKVSASCFHCVSFFFLSFPTLFSFLSSMTKLPASLPSFSHFATGSSPFLQFALCSFPESLRKSGDQKEEALPQEAGIGSFFFLSLLSFFFFFFKTKSVLPFSFLLRVLIKALEILSLLFLKEL